MGDSDILSYQPGQTVTFYKEVKNVNGQRTDDGYVPVVTRVVYPGFVAATGYPQSMSRLDVGLYFFQLVIPQGATAVGTYLVDIVYKDPNSLLLVSDSRQIVVTAPYGNYSTSTIGSGGPSGLPGPPGPAGPPGPYGIASGDLSGLYPNPKVIAIQGRAISPTVPGDGYALTWSATDGYWEPKSIAIPAAADASVQATWYIDPLNVSGLANDTNTGLTSGTPIRTLAEFQRRVTPLAMTAWVIKSNVAVHFLSYPPSSDPLRLAVKFWQNPGAAGPTLDFYGPTLTTNSSGSFTAVTTRNRATNTPYVVTDGVVVTTSDPTRRIRITSGPRAGATAWVATSPGAGQRRTSEWAQWDALYLPTPVIPLVGDTYVVESSATQLYVDYIHIDDGAPGANPNQATLTFHNMDFRPITNNSVVSIENNGCALAFASCSFSYGEWAVRTNTISGDNISGNTMFQNCALLGPSGTGIGNLFFLHGSFVDNACYGGLFYGQITARQGAGVVLDFDGLSQTLGGSVCPPSCVSGGQLAINAWGVMDWGAYGGVIVIDAVAALGFFGNSGITPSLWGTTGSAGWGVDVRAGGTFRYQPAPLITITASGGDFKLAGDNTARAWDDVAGAYTANIACTWVNLVGGTLKDNAHCIMRNAHAYLNPSGASQAQP